VDSKDQGLLAAFWVLIADGEEVAARLAEQQDGGDREGKNVAAAGVLAVFEEVNVLVGDAEFRALSGQDK
jgi:hypothetical protein